MSEGLVNRKHNDLLGGIIVFGVRRTLCKNVCEWLVDKIYLLGFFALLTRSFVISFCEGSMDKINTILPAFVLNSRPGKQGFLVQDLRGGE